MAASPNYRQSTEFERRNNDSDGRAWITPEGRGETCRTPSCHAQISVRHTLSDEGETVTLCVDCRAAYTDEVGR